LNNRKFEKKISEVPWADRKTATGDAYQIPEALSEIRSPDADVRKRAYWKIDNHVVLQSDLYEAAYDVVPFLIDIVRDRTSFGRELAYDLLFEIANGYAPEDVTCEIGAGERVPLQVACHMALIAGQDVFEGDRHDPDPVIRSKASELLERLQGD